MDPPLYPCRQWDKTLHGQRWEPALFKRQAAVSSTREVYVSQQAQGMQNPRCCWPGKGCASTCSLVLGRKRTTRCLPLHPRALSPPRAPPPSLLAPDLAFRG